MNQEFNFEDLEKEIYRVACEAARKATAQIIEQLDKQLVNQRDKERYIIKQKRKGLVKTIYGEVQYNRRQYFDIEKDSYVFLIDEILKLDKIGKVSMNFAKLCAYAVKEMPYRKAAEMISTQTGQVISANGIWNVIQELGKTIQEDEKIKVSELINRNTKGKDNSKLLFMEADGVYINIQKDKKKAPAKEMKVSTVYEGWSKDGKKLVNKKVYAGMENADDFNIKTEAQIQNIYDTNKIMARILNGDGAEWIKNTYEPIRIYQLDRFHVMKKITESITNKNVKKLVVDHYRNGEIKEMFERIKTYRNSIEEPKKIEKVNELLTYLSNNKQGLVPWQKQMKKLPEAPEDIEYKNMGVQEGQNCNLITMRMKNRKMRWSEEGANNLAKVMYTIENKDLDRIMKDNPIGTIVLPNGIEVDTILSASKVKEVVGKGGGWIEKLQGGMPVLNSNHTPISAYLRRLSYA